MLCFLPVFAQRENKDNIFDENKLLWQKISGNWQISENEGTTFLYDKYYKSVKYGYNDLINHNAIVSLEQYKFNTLTIKANLHKPQPNSTFTIMFNNSEDYLRNFYAVRIFGNSEKINRIAFIQSKINDDTLLPKVKHNFTITEIVSKDIDLNYNENFLIEIKLNKKNNVEVKLNKKRVLKWKLENLSENTRIAFYHTDNLVNVFELCAKQNKKQVLFDCFAIDKIKRAKVKGTVTK